MVVSLHAGDDHQHTHSDLWGGGGVICAVLHVYCCVCVYR